MPRRRGRGGGGARPAVPVPLPRQPFHCVPCGRSFQRACALGNHLHSWSHKEVIGEVAGDPARVPADDRGDLDDDVDDDAHAAVGGHDGPGRFEYLLDLGPDADSADGRSKFFPYETKSDFGAYDLIDGASRPPLIAL